MKSLIKFLVLGAVAAAPVLAHATPIVGSDAYAYFNVTAPNGPITASTIFGLSGGITTSKGTGDFSAITAGTAITESATFNPASNGFQIVFGSYGTFTETVAPVNESIAANGNGANYYLVGTFTPAGALSTFTPGAASLEIAFTRSTTAGAPDSFSGSGTIASPPAGTLGATPEPSSLVLLGSGLVGIAGMARRKFRK